MKLVTFAHDGTSAIGALTDGEIVDLTAAGIADNMNGLIALGADGLGAAGSAVAARDAIRLPLDTVRLRPPLLPGKVLCCGINYRSHARENPDAVMPQEPFFFAKMPSSIAGPEDDIRIPEMSSQVDYEVEFAVVIGQRLDCSEEAEVMPAIFGYTLLNDISARDVQFKDAQITLGKNFNGFAPIGPVIVTGDELTDPGSVQLLTRVNGKTLQNGNTSDWLFALPRLLSFLSRVMVLHPGDLVTTGTPAGVGLFQNPPIFLKDGDVVEIEAPEIGILRNRMVRAVKR